MTSSNYALTGGTAVLATVAVRAKSTLIFQMYHSSIVATNVTLEAHIGLNSGKTFAKLDFADKAVVAGSGTTVMVLTDVPAGCYIQFKLVVPTASTAGTIVEYEVAGGY